MKVIGLFGSKGAQTILTSDSIYQAAQKRSLLGNPPFSEDKHTIGDEVIWESLLAHCDEDLVIVTRDNGFLNYEHILRAEFRTPKRRLLRITKKLSEALQIVGETAPKNLVEEEQRIENELRCPKCGGSGEVGGFEGSDGDEASWFECKKCGIVDFR